MERPSDMGISCAVAVHTDSGFTRMVWSSLWQDYFYKMLYVFNDKNLQAEKGLPQKP